MTYKVTSAHEEGGERIYSVSTTHFVDNGAGQVKGLALTEVEFVNGKFEPVDGTEQEIPADLVFLAMGFVGPERSPLLEQLGVELDARGNVDRNASYMSNVDGVFVAGDAGRGQSLIVWAIAEGRSAASGVDQWLTGSTTLPSPVAPTLRPLVI
jgi:glutamate synthase (NADPH/NADH) small chain